VKVSPACAHCYAETFSKRVGQKVWGIEAPRRFFGPKHWKEPLAWDKSAQRDGVRRRVFCASMADVFEDREDVKQARLDLFHTIEETSHLDWLLLTKRPENIRRLLPSWYRGKPWPNVWLGTTVETQEYFESRVGELLMVPAVVHFLSIEPMLGPIDLHLDEIALGFDHEALDGQIDWVIAGGESGAGCRVSDPQWIRQLRDQCVQNGVPFHFKQWGGFYAKANGCELDGRAWKEFPQGRERTS
jgi:protein gp37